MIGARQLGRMRDGTTFINTARGVIVDHDALRTELITGRISAVLDVTDPEPLRADDALFGLPNVVLTPHLAGPSAPSSIASRQRPCRRSRPSRKAVRRCTRWQRRTSPPWRDNQSVLIRSGGRRRWLAARPHRRSGRARDRRS